SSGATLGILLSMIVGLEPHVWPLLSFLGGLLALSFTLTASALAGYSPLSLIVAGVSVSYLFYSLNVVLLTLYHAEIRGSPMMWLFGSLAYVKMNELFIAFSIVLLGVSIVLVFHKELDVLVLEDDVAESLGVRRSLVRALSTGAATLAATAATTISGPIGFVGIVAPWIARLLSKEGFLELSIASGLIGSTIVVLADLTIRGIFGGVEIPVTAMTAVIGAPLLAYMLLKLQSYG
ncbi:MAG: iron ABC transporter permease, partial [Acidilobaceae archaeon]